MIDESVCNRCGESRKDHFEAQAVRVWEDNRGSERREAATIVICPTALFEGKYT